MTQQTAVARTDQQGQSNDGEEKGLAFYQGYGKLNRPARAAVERSRALRRSADVVGATAWGARLTLVQRAAMAEWCERRDADPVTDIDDLGGPYLNSDYYLRKLGELRTRGIVADVKRRHIGNDPRLAALAKDDHAPKDVREEAAREHYARLQARIAFGVPEEAAAAHVTEIYLVGGGAPVTGVKWGGNGTSVRQPKHGGGSSPNPVVEANPHLSVESQSARRAMRELATRFPGVLPDDSDSDEELREMREEIRATATLARDEALPHGGAVAAIGAGDGYETDIGPRSAMPQPVPADDPAVQGDAAALDPAAPTPAELAEDAKLLRTEDMEPGELALGDRKRRRNAQED